MYFLKILSWKRHQVMYLTFPHLITPPKICGLCTMHQAFQLLQLSGKALSNGLKRNIVLFIHVTNLESRKVSQSRAKIQIMN